MAGTGAIEVQIATTRPSVFAGIIGRTAWDVGSRAVAVNQTGTSGPFALLSLHETACNVGGLGGGGLLVEDTGVVTSNGNIQVKSSRTTDLGAFRVAGTGTLDLLGAGIGCNIVGGYTFGGGVAINDCDPPNTPATAIPDPYSGLGDPTPIPPLPAAMERWDPATNSPWTPATEPPAGCPGSATPATEDAPRKCLFGGAFDGQTWRVYPGYYPGGIDFGSGNFLLEPGLYYIGDGGFRVANASATSVDAGGLTFAGGVLIFNSDHPSPTTDPGPIVLDGGSAVVKLWRLVGTGDYAAYDDGVLALVSMARL